MKRLLRRIKEHLVYRPETRRILRDGVAAKDGREAQYMLGRFRGPGDMGSIHTIQAADEITRLLDFIREQNVRVACEIGTYLGGTLFMLTRILPDDAFIISLDWPDADPHDPERLRRRKPLFQRFARKHQQIAVVQLDSHDPATVEELRSILNGRQLDFLFIDADHSTQGVRADFTLYSPLVREGGWIAFHDIIPNNSAADWGIPPLWEELKQHYKTIEFVDPSIRAAQQGMGIGLLQWKQP